MIESWLINNGFKGRKYHDGSKVTNLGVTPAFSLLLPPKEDPFITDATPSLPSPPPPQRWSLSDRGGVDAESERGMGGGDEPLGAKG